MYGISDTELSVITRTFEANERISAVILYGSRAKGNYKPFSDVDLTLVGDNLSRKDINYIYAAFDESSLPYKFDISIFNSLKNDKLIEHIKNGKDLFATKAAGRYERMSSGKYYEVCSYCYAAAGYEELDGKTPKEMFKRHGDDRDGGMSLLDETSKDDFDKWFKLSTQEKWKIENPSHMWEISCGHTHTMIHLYLFWDDGYWFYLSGGTHCLTTEVVRMYNAMKDKGVPVLLGHAGQIADKLLGNDDLGIIPNNDMGWRYWYGGFPKDDVINFVQLSDGNAEAVIKNATWFDIADVKLSDK